MKKILAILLVVALMASFTACNNNQNQENSGNNVIQGGEQNNGNNTQNGDEQAKPEGTVISLEGNGTTGYAWYPMGYDTTIIDVEDLGTESISGIETENGSGEDIVGAPSLFKFRVNGVSGGVSDLTFKYYRAWEGSEAAIETKSYVVVVDNLLNVTVTERVEEDIPAEDDFTLSEELQTLLDTLLSNSGVQFRMPASMKIAVENAPTFVGLSEDLFTSKVVDSLVYEPMISPATSSLCIVKIDENADVASLKQTVLENSNPAKWICTGAEKVLVIESGRYIMLVMSTPEDCEALKTAFTNHFGAENVGEALTKDGLPAMDEGDFGGGMAL